MDGMIMTALIFDTETHKLHGDIIEAAGISIDINFMDRAKISPSFTVYPELLIGRSFQFEDRYKPSEPISFGAMAVHHIVDEDQVKCLPYTAFKFPKNLNIKYLIGHNIDYDIAAVNRAGIATGEFKAICTLAMARFLWPNLDSHTLSAVALYVSKNRGKTAHDLRFAHSALNDCRTTISVLIAIIHEAGISSFEELYEFSEKARYPTHIFYGKYRGWAIKDLDDRDLHWLFNKTEDDYLRISLENEILSRNNINEDEELPFV